MCDSGGKLPERGQLFLNDELLLRVAQNGIGVLLLPVAAKQDNGKNNKNGKRYGADKENPLLAFIFQFGVYFYER